MTILYFLPIFHYSQATSSFIHTVNGEVTLGHCYTYPTNELFIKYNILKFTDMVQEQNILILHKFVNDALPHAMTDFFRYTTPSSRRIIQHFSIPFTYRQYRLYAITHSAPKSWNNVICKIFPSIQQVPRKKDVLKKCIRCHFMELCKSNENWSQTIAHTIHKGSFKSCTLLDLVSVSMYENVQIMWLIGLFFGSFCVNGYW